MSINIEDCLKMFTPASGLFGTEVTWDDIEEKIRSALGTAATFGNGKTVSNIGDGKGFFSRICLIEPDWQNANAKEELPSKFVAKIPTVLAALPTGDNNALSQYKDNKEIMMQFAPMLIHMQAGLKTMHNAECTVYKLIKKYGMQDKIKSPKIYYKKVYTDEIPGYILMEYKSDVQELPIHDNISPEALHQPLRCLAALEVLSLRTTDEEIASLKNRTFKDVFGQIFVPEKIQMFLGMANDFGKGELDELINKISAHTNQLGDIDFYDTLPEKLGLRRVLCHGDLWSGNILWTEKQGKYGMESLIDYQNAHFGLAVTDICRLLCSTLSGEQLRTNWEHLLEVFYEYLLDELNGEEAPYSLKSLKESYKVFFPLGAIGMIPMLLRKQMKGEEANAKVDQRSLRKCKSLLEDTLSFAENRPSFI